MRLTILPLLALMLSPLGIGCASRPLATCPAKGGYPWHEVRSPHFRVYADLNTLVARTTALELEQLRSALLIAWGGRTDLPGQVEVIVVRDATTLKEFTRGMPMEAFMDSSGRTPLLVMTGSSEYVVELPETRQVQAHELAHHISRFVMVRQPRWLSEGLATWFQNVRFSPLWKQATFQGFHEEHYRYLEEHGLLSLKQLWAWDEQPHLSASEALPYYASSWLWVMYLLDRHPERFQDFQERLERAEEPHQAWEATFQGVEGLEEDAQRYEPSREHQLTVKLPDLQHREFEVRTLDCAEIHAMRARLFLRSPGYHPLRLRLRLAIHEVEEALREDPTNVSAVLLQATLTPEPERRLAVARALVQAQPESGPAWSLLGQTLQEVGAPVAEQEQALRRALALHPEDVDALVAMAWLHTEKGETDEGLTKARHAVQLAPGRASTLEAYAALLFQAGRCAESLTAQQRAINVLEGHITESLREAAEATRGAMQRKLAEYERGCAGEQAP